MAKTHKRLNNDDKSDKEKPRNRGHKDLKTRSKNSWPKRNEDENKEKAKENRHTDPKKSNPKNIGDIKTQDLGKSIAGVFRTIDKRKGKGSLEEKEVIKHRDAIIATVNKTTGPRKNTDKQKKLQKSAPRNQEPAPRNTEPAPRNTDPTPRKPVPGIPDNWTLTIQSKRKNRKSSNSESDSSDPIKSKSKKAKRSRISETSIELTSSSEDEVVALPPRCKNRHRETRNRHREIRNRHREIRTRLRENRYQGYQITGR